MNTCCSRCHGRMLPTRVGMECINCSHTIYLVSDEELMMDRYYQPQSSAQALIASGTIFEIHRKRYEK